MCVLASTPAYFFPTPTHVHTTFYESVHFSLSLSLSPSLVIKIKNKKDVKLKFAVP